MAQSGRHFRMRVRAAVRTDQPGQLVGEEGGVREQMQSQARDGQCAQDGQGDPKGRTKSGQRTSQEEAESPRVAKGVGLGLVLKVTSHPKMRTRKRGG